MLQWVIPGLTGAALVLNALMGEQQRPQQVTGGLLQGLGSRYGPGGWRTQAGQANQLSHDATPRFASCAVRPGVSFNNAPASPGIGLPSGPRRSGAMSETPLKAADGEGNRHPTA